MWLDAIKSKRDRVPDPPEWVEIIVLARRMGKMPSDIENEPMEWVVRLREFFYQVDRQGVEI